MHKMGLDTNIDVIFPVTLIGTCEIAGIGTCKNKTLILLALATLTI